MKLKNLCCLMLAAILSLGWAAALPSCAEAVSLWGSRNIFADRKASQVGDILTIVIRESSTTTQALSNSNSKSGNNNLNAGVGIFSFLAAASASGSDSFKADGSAKNTNAATGTVTVTVTEVRPNGNLVVEGNQSIWNNKNEHRITLRGVVRGEDIAYDNTISSNKVADATLTFDGKGPLNSKQRQGILTQIFNILF